MTDLYFFYSSIDWKNCKSTAELAIPTGISSYKANTKIEKHLLTGETKIRICLC